MNKLGSNFQSSYFSTFILPLLPFSQGTDSENVLETNHEINADTFIFPTLFELLQYDRNVFDEKGKFSIFFSIKKQKKYFKSCHSKKTWRTQLLFFEMEIYLPDCYDRVCHFSAKLVFLVASRYRLDFRCFLYSHRFAR